jgi:hypothetical protein
LELVGFVEVEFGEDPQELRVKLIREINREHL